MDKRPKLDKYISVKDFRDFYWLKEELVQFCRTEQLKTSGGKIEIAHRIEHYLEHGKAPTEKAKSKRKIQSNFDWANEQLSLQTIITDNYRNSENVRHFFQKQIGKTFKFNVKFMNWMKSNTGKTLENAIAAWLQIEEDKKSNKQAKKIAPQFEYNTYLRDYLAQNPNGSRETGIKLWKIKRSMRGDNVYRDSDLNYLED